MFYAVNSQTNEIVNSLSIESNPSYEFIHDNIFYADPDEIESCPNEIDINKIVVNFKEGKKDIVNFKGTKYNVSPHFFIPNKSKLGINIIPESKEHKLAKNWIYNRLFKNKDFRINYSTISKPYKYHNFINLLELPIDKEKVGIEVTSSTYHKKSRRADIICPFIIKHPLLGNGIVFEIQFSNQKEKTKLDRELDWAIRGYSVCWLFEDDFNFFSDILCDIKNDYVNVDSWTSLIKYSNKEQIKNLKFAVEEMCRKLDWKKLNIEQSLNDKFDKILSENLDIQIRELVKREIEDQLEYIIADIKKSVQPKCGKCGSPARVSINRSNNSKFWSCPNYPVCQGWTMPYD